MKTREELQKYMNQLYTRLDFWTDEYDDDRIVNLLIGELNTMHFFVTDTNDTSDTVIL